MVASSPPEHPIPTGATAGDFARLLGVTERVVAGRKADGRLPKLSNGAIDLHAVIRAGVEALSKRRGESGSTVGQQDPSTLPGRPDGSLSTEEAERLEANLRAHQRMLEVKRLRGELVDKAAAERLFFEAGRNLRDSFLGWPAREAALIASEIGADPARTLAVLEREMRVHLKQVPPPSVTWPKG